MRSLLRHSQMPSPQHLPNGRVVSYHDNSVHEEDAFVIRELSGTIALDAVLDGATGHGGKFASRFVAASLMGARCDSLDDLVTIIEAANRRLFQRGKGSFLLTTLAATLKTGDVLQILSVGDSTVYLISEGEIVALATTEKGPTPFGITSALGRHAKLSYSVKQITLQPHDRLVLMTDGITNNVAPTELASLIQPTASPQEAVSALQDLLHEKKSDNRGRADDHGGFTRDDATAIIRYLE